LDDTEPYVAVVMYKSACKFASAVWTGCTKIVSGSFFLFPAIFVWDRNFHLKQIVTRKEQPLCEKFSRSVIRISY